jgi:flagellar hook-length control protein FliK
MQFFPFVNTDTTSSSLEGLFQGNGSSSRPGLFDSHDDTRRAQFAALLDDELAAVRDDVAGREEAVRTMWDKARSGAQALASGRLVPGGPDFGEEAVSSRRTRSKTATTLSTMISGSGPVSGARELSELQMTREDFLALRDGLKAYGLSRADIQALEERISSGSGLSWGQFLGSLSQKMVESGREFSSLNLSDAESRDMLTLFQKLGMTAARSNELLGTLQNGGTATVWLAIRSRLGELPEGSTVELTSSELATLGKVMRLSDGGQGRLAALLGGADSAELTSRQLGVVMTMLRAEVAADRRWTPTPTRPCATS